MRQTTTCCVWRVFSSYYYFLLVFPPSHRKESNTKIEDKTFEVRTTNLSESSKNSIKVHLLYHTKKKGVYDNRHKKCRGWIRPGPEAFSGFGSDPDPDPSGSGRTRGYPDPDPNSGPGCRVRVLDPTRYPKDPTRRTRVGSNL